MPPELPPFLGAWGPAAIAAAAVFGVLFGWLIPLRTHRRELTRADKEIAERDARIRKLETAVDVHDARADLAQERVGKLLTGMDTIIAIVSALQRKADDHDQGSRAKETL